MMIIIMLYDELEIHLVERGICPIATLYSLAAAFLLREPSYRQFCPKICCHGNGCRQGRNLHDTIE